MQNNKSLREEGFIASEFQKNDIKILLINQLPSTKTDEETPPTAIVTDLSQAPLP